MKSGLFTGESFAPAEQFGINLGKFLQTLPKALVSLDALSALLPLRVGFEQEFEHTARHQTDRQIIKGAVLVPLSAGAVGLATGGEPLDEGGAQELGRNAQLTQERSFALAQGQSRSAAEPVYLSQYIGEDSKPRTFGKKKEFASEIYDNANLPNSLNLKELSSSTKKASEIAVIKANLGGAKLSGACLVGAELIRADLREADLTEANLRCADLNQADLSAAKLNATDLRGADLSEANLSESSLANSSFAQAGLFQTVFASTSLKTAKGLESCKTCRPKRP